MAEAIRIDAVDAPGPDGDGMRFVTFQAADEVFALPMQRVLEIIRVPEAVEVPLTPPALLGLANLRGRALPVLDLRRLLGLPHRDPDDGTRVLVTDCGEPLGLLVDRVLRVRVVESGCIDTEAGVGSGVATDCLEGVIQDEAGLAQLLRLDSLVVASMPPAGHRAPSLLAAAPGTPARGSGGGRAEAEPEQLVAFEVDGQEYAFPLLDVAEIVRPPEHVAKVPRAPAHVLGLVDLRGDLLPLVSLRGLFGLPAAGPDERSRILVVQLPGRATARHRVGLLVDDVREVLPLPPGAREPVPPLLGADADEVVAVCRLEDGRRLISVLGASELFSDPGVQAALAAGDAGTDEEASTMAEAVRTDDEAAQLVVFALGAQQFGVPIDRVQEITRVPETLDRVPRTPTFVEGMVNLRGSVLPVLDLRTRFGLDRLPRSDRQRIVVLALGGRRTGFVVDSVVEVLRLPREAIASAPVLSEDQARVMGRIVNLEGEGRLIQVLDPAALLSADEHADLEAAG